MGAARKLCDVHKTEGENLAVNYAEFHKKFILNRHSYGIL